MFASNLRLGEDRSQVLVVYPVIRGEQRWSYTEVIVEGMFYGLLHENDIQIGVYLYNPKSPSPQFVLSSHGRVPTSESLIEVHRATKLGR